MLHTPSYNPNLPFEKNYAEGPFGEVANLSYVEPATVGAHTFLGQKINFRIGMPAGPILNSRFGQAFFNAGFDVLTYKTVRSSEKKSSPYPNIVPLELKGDITPKEAATEGVRQAEEFAAPLSITNSFGVPSVGPDKWQPDMKRMIEVAHEGQLVIGAFQGTNRGEGEDAFIKDHVATARMVVETGAKVLEVNTSCPNEGTRNLLCYDTKRMQQIAHAIKDEIGNTPLVVKLAYFEDEKQLEELVSAIGEIVDGIAAINTIGGKILKKDGEQALPGEGRLWSGICGAGIGWAGLDMVKRLKALREKKSYSFEIVGVGGMASADDYKEYRAAGADLVMSATGAMWNPYLAQEIKKNAE